MSVALVTGASQGIGRAIALRLASDGLNVAVNDLSSKRDQLNAVVAEIKAKGRSGYAVTGDVSSEADVKAMIGNTVSTLGSLDVMVANAGLLLVGPITETPIEDFDRLMSVNARGVYLCYKHAGAQMIKQGKGGRIIGASSISGKKGFANLSLYSMSKFAVRGLTQSCASEWISHNITVNSYGPAWVTTDMMNDSKVKNVMGLNADTVATTPESIAGLVSYLVKPESRFITGQTIAMDGGSVGVD